MSDYDESIDDGTDDSAEVKLSAKDLKNLRAKAKKADEYEGQLTSAQRELAFAKAKLDLEDPKMDYFINGYKGELTTEAIRAEAQRAGFVQADQGGNQGNPDRDSIQRIQQASNGASSGGDPNVEEAIRNASSPEEVIALMTKAGFPTTYNRPVD